MSEVIDAAERRLRSACADQKLSLYISSRDWRARNPYIHLVQQGFTLASFKTFQAALDWLPQGVQR